MQDTKDNITKDVPLRDGSIVTVKDLSIGDIVAIGRIINEHRQEFDGNMILKEGVPDIEVALHVMDKAPMLAYKILGRITDRNPKEITSWKALDLMNVLNAILEVNDFAALKESFLNFFQMIRGQRPNILNLTPGQDSDSNLQKQSEDGQKPTDSK